MPVLNPRSGSSPSGLGYHGAVKRLIIADSHLGQRRGDLEAMSGVLEHARTTGVGEVIYLGDAFQYLIGMAKFWTSSVHQMLGRWEACRRHGMRVVLVEGNRDFFLDEPDLAPHLDRCGRCYEFSADDRRYRLVHGDLVNQRDLQYQFWAKVSKCRPARLWARWLPRRLAVAIVTRMEAKLATTNKRYRYHKPIAALVREAETAWSEGVDVLLWGHFHTFWKHEQENETRLAMVVPAWMETRHALLVGENGEWCWVDHALTPVAAVPTITEP